MMASSCEMLALRAGVGIPQRLQRIVRSQCVRHRGHYLAQLRAWVEHLQNGPSCGMNLAPIISRRSEPDDLEAANASVARI
jgi:hypothetical protein